MIKIVPSIFGFLRHAFHSHFFFPDVILFLYSHIVFQAERIIHEGWSKETNLTTTTMILKLIVFMGSARNVIPPWGGDARLGTRVLNHVKTVLGSRSGKLGEDSIKYDFTVVDPIDVFGPGGGRCL